MEKGKLAIKSDEEEPKGVRENRRRDISGHIFRGRPWYNDSHSSEFIHKVIYVKWFMLSDLNLVIYLESVSKETSAGVERN